MRILVTGSRNYDKQPVVSAMLGALAESAAANEVVTIVEGGAKGADECAFRFGGTAQGYAHERHPADWQTHGKRAGFVRNQEMVDAGADVCVAFKDEFDFDMKRGGTEHCVKSALKAGIPVYLVTRMDDR